MAQFSWDLTQQQVLQHSDGALLVLGAAGTGKTSVVVELLAAKFVAHAKPALGLCVSRQEASQVRDAVVRAVGQTAVAPSVMTIHSLCLALHARYADPEDSLVTLLTAPEQEFRIRELLHANQGAGWTLSVAGATATKAFARQVRGVLARVRQLGLDPEDLVASGEQAGEPDWARIGMFMAEYLDVLDHERVLDYSELVHRARILLENPDVVADVRRQWSALYVDDCAELDPAALSLVHQLAGRELPFIGFADPDTAIYRFRGAHPRATAEIVRLFDCETVTLGVQYRCPGVVGQALSALSRRLSVPMISTGAVKHYRSSHGDKPGELDVVTFEHDAQQWRYVCAELREAHLQNGVPWSEMAVLVRSGRERIAEVGRALVDAGIPVDMAGDDLGLVDELAVQPLLQAMAAAAGIEEMTPERATRLMASPWAGASPVGMRALTRELVRQRSVEADPNSVLGSILDGAEVTEPDLEPGSVAAATWKILIARRDLLAQARELIAKKARAEDVLWLLWDGTPWPHELQRQALDGGDCAHQAHRDLDVVIELFEVAKASHAPGGRSGVTSFLAEVAAQNIRADMQRESALRQRGVSVMTAHRAKGRSWSFVAVVAVQEGVWPDVRRQGGLFDAQRLETYGLAPELSLGELVATERRLFALAVSRASKRLIVSAVDPGPVGDDDDSPVTDRASRFVRELGVPVRHVVDLPDRLHTLRDLVVSLRRAAHGENSTPELAAAAAVRLARLSAERDGRGRPLVPAADPGRWWGLLAPTSVALPAPEGPVRLSASSVEALLNCPLQYFLARKAQGDVVSGLSASVGTLVHDVLAKRGAGELDEASALDYLSEAWQNLTFAAAWQSAAQLEEARAAVVRYGVWDAEQEGTCTIGIEKTFEVELQMGEHHVALTGTIDRAQTDSQGRLRVIDYKTGGVITEADAHQHVQLGVYQVVVESGAFGPYASGGGELVFVKHERKGGVPAVRYQAPLSEVRYLDDGTDERAYPSWAHQRIAQACAIVQRGVYDATPGSSCSYCRFVSLCPAQSEQVIS